MIVGILGLGGAQLRTKQVGQDGYVAVGDVAGAGQEHYIVVGFKLGDEL